MEIQPFTKDRWSIGRPIIAEQIPWLKGKGVAASLEYANARDALHRHVEPEDKTTYSELTKGVVNPDTLSNQQPPRSLHQRIWALLSCAEIHQGRGQVF